MTQQEYKNKIKELEKQIEELKTAKIEGPQSKRWKPNENEKYWAVDGYGKVVDIPWTDDDYDNWKYISGNCFKTREEAIEYRNQIKYTARYKNYIEEHSEPLNWNNDRQEKYCAQYEYGCNRIYIASYHTIKNQGTIYASSEEIILDAIKEIGEDNFKKYVLRVK